MGQYVNMIYIHSAHIDNFDGKTILNVGSVGNPLDITQASYGIIRGKLNDINTSPLAVSVIRVPYDIELAVNHAELSDMPDKNEYINELRTAKYRGKKSMKNKYYTKLFSFMKVIFRK